MEWPQLDNISIVYLSKNSVDEILSAMPLKRSMLLAKSLSSYVNIYLPERVILNDLVPFMPFLPLWLRKRNLINGIQYKIPRHRDPRTFKTWISDCILFSLYARSKCFRSVFLLNDESSPQWYNKKLKTTVFKYLPDPINIPVDTEFRDQHHYSKDKIILVHGGGLGTRKGTFKIIEALKLMDSTSLKRFKVHFVGFLANKEERNKVKEFINEWKDKIEISFSDSFVEFDYLLEVIRNGDYVLIPYENVEQSSGFLCYAAYFKKPVIGPSQGLLGDLIRNYSLGIDKDLRTAESLKDVLLSLEKVRNYSKNQELYVNSRNPYDFSRKVFS